MSDEIKVWGASVLVDQENRSSVDRRMSVAANQWLMAGLERLLCRQTRHRQAQTRFDNSIGFRLRDWLGMRTVPEEGSTGRLRDVNGVVCDVLRKNAWLYRLLEGLTITGP